VFPLVYAPFYGFSVGMIGVVFTSILVACMLGMIEYMAYLHWYLIPDILKRGNDIRRAKAPCFRLVPE
jgi:MFS transporter, DHA1 family, multidrug resistance protein